VNHRIMALALAGAIVSASPGIPGLNRIALAAPKNPTQPALLWSSQSLQAGEMNTVVFWSPGMGLEPKIRVKPTAGKVTEVVAVDDKITITYKAPESIEVGSIHFQVKGSGDSGPVQGTIEVLLKPSSLPPIQVELDPPVFNFGEAGVRVRLTPPPSELDDVARDIRVHTSVGDVTKPMAAGDGTWVARWTPPDTMDSSTVMLLAASEPGSPHEVLGSAMLPIQVKRDLSFQVTPDSQNILRVGTREWGPIQASTEGVVQFDAALDPRIPTGALQSVTPAGSEERTVELFWESPDVFVLFPLSRNAVADPTQPVDMHLLVFGPDGSPREGASPTFSTTTDFGVEHGQLGDTREITPGLYRVDLNPPETGQQGAVSIAMGGQTTGQELDFVDRAGRATISLEPSGLSAEQDSTGARAVLYDASGTPRDGTEASFHVSGGSLDSRTRIDGDGGSTNQILLSEDTFETVAVAWPSSSSSTGLPPAQLIAWAPGSSVPADGTTRTPLVVVAVDRFGMGVPGIALDLRIGTGGGWVSPSATTDASGVAVVDYRAGRSFGPAEIRVRGKGLQQIAIVYQHDGLSDPPAAPAPTALESAWMERVASTRLSRERPPDRPAPEVGPLATPEPVAVVAPTGPETAVPAAPSAGDSATPSIPSPGVSTPSVITTAPLSGSREPLQLRAGVLVLNHTYSMTSDVAGYAPTASFDHSAILGTPGLDLRATMGIQDEIGLDTRARVFTERLGAGDSVAWNLEWAVLVGASYSKSPTAWLSWAATGHIHHQTVSAFSYANAARTELDLIPMKKWGLRVGASARAQILDGFIELEAAETLGLLPVDHYIGGTAGWKLDERMTATLGFDLDIRSMRSTFDATAIEVDDRVQGIRLGIQTAL
jgi:hypothetical protein